MCEPRGRSVVAKKLVAIPSRDELIQLLECPVCYRIPLPPVWNCKRGHFVCDTCRSKLQKCPLCRCKFGASRNLAVESIVLSSKFVCDYQQQGCGIIVEGMYFLSHKAACQFRPMRCHLGGSNGCNFAEINFANYFDHLVTVHKLMGGKEEDDASVVIRQKFRNETRTDKHYWIYTYKKFDGKVFLGRSYRLGCHFYWSVVIIGSDLEASVYAAKIIIQRKREQVPKFEVTIPIVSVRNSRGLIEEDLPHAMLTENQLKYFCTPVDIGGGAVKYQWRTQYRILKLNQQVELISKEQQSSAPPQRLPPPPPSVETPGKAAF